MRGRRSLTAAARIALSLALFIAPVVAAGCGSGTEDATAPDDAATANPVVQPPEPPAPLEMKIGVEKAQVVLGDDIVFQVELTNRSNAKQTVNIPRLALNSLRFRVRHGANVARLERYYFDIGPTGEIQWKPNAVAELAPGDSVQQEVRTPAVLAGKLMFMPAFRWRGGPEIQGEQLAVEVTPAGKHATLGAVMDTSLGEMTFRLRPGYAYASVESFVSLAKKGFFDGTVFHRIVAGFMAQGGDPEGTGGGGPGYFLPGEMHGKLFHERGVLSMARTGIPRIGKDTAGSQFFILFARRPDLDPGDGPGREGYTTFGEMLKGDEALAALEAVQVRRSPAGEMSQPVEKITLNSVKVITLP